MGEREDAEREFERVFGKVQRPSEEDASVSSSIHAPTQKLPSDSDVLGIRTDSDRFIFKNPIPERLPVEPSPRIASDSPSPEKGNGTPAQDAMTIALNVNVFANIPKPGEERKPGDLSNVTWSEATQLFVKKPSASVSPADPTIFVVAEPSKLGPGSGLSGAVEPTPSAKFTRLFHVQDSVTLPQSAVQPSAQNSIAATPVFQDPVTKPTASVPSDFTRVVKGSELRALQEKLAAASGAPAPPDQNMWSAPSSPTPSLPTGMATQIWSASSAQTQRSAAPAMQAWTPPNTNLPPIAKPPDLPVAEPSKLSQYMPLILVLNLLFLLAILLIVFFAIKK